MDGEDRGDGRHSGPSGDGPSGYIRDMAVRNDRPPDPAARFGRARIAHNLTPFPHPEGPSPDGPGMRTINKLERKGW